MSKGGLTCDLPRWRRTGRRLFSIQNSAGTGSARGGGKVNQISNFRSVEGLIVSFLCLEEVRGKML